MFLKMRNMILKTVACKSNDFDDARSPKPLFLKTVTCNCIRDVPCLLSFLASPPNSAGRCIWRDPRLSAYALSFPTPPPSSSACKNNDFEDS